MQLGDVQGVFGTPTTPKAPPWAGGASSAGKIGLGGPEIIKRKPSVTLPSPEPEPKKPRLRPERDEYARVKQRKKGDRIQFDIPANPNAVRDSQTESETETNAKGKGVIRKEGLPKSKPKSRDKPKRSPQPNMKPNPSYQFAGEERDLVAEWGPNITANQGIVLQWAEEYEKRHGIAQSDPVDAGFIPRTIVKDAEDVPMDISPSSSQRSSSNTLSKGEYAWQYFLKHSDLV
ncbi:hypothetical protein ABW19_dt0206291 [Dactylella cylindrospora]|nr:hypothetical protein ABW19_dt0206291 [Dactylella cylindrospora]